MRWMTGCEILLTADMSIASMALLLFGRQLAEAAALALELLARDAAQLLPERADRRADVERRAAPAGTASPRTRRSAPRARPRARARGCSRRRPLRGRPRRRRRGCRAWPTAGSTLRGTLMSMKKAGRLRRAARAALGHLGRDDVVARAGRADDDVGLRQSLFERAELDGLAAELDGEPLRRLVGAVGDEHARRARARRGAARPVPPSRPRRRAARSRL